MTLEEPNCLAKKIKFLKRKGSSIGEPPKKARTRESSQAVPIQAMPGPEPTTTASSSILPDEVTILLPPTQEETIEGQKKKKAIRKKAGRVVGNSRGKSSNQK
ncbi:hypothetical protein COCNU_11G004130 [Cocos nucifera]|uniref:Uncharacterized protein n=1 Tax=Cocos nucifera TaxID=13894 RepID=A0A8K0INN4_COCNU|nr:hypothetical protein COCNU_11G004130 [Cocos nucifera]